MREFDYVRLRAKTRHQTKWFMHKHRVRSWWTAEPFVPVWRRADLGRDFTGRIMA